MTNPIFWQRTTFTLIAAGVCLAPLAFGGTTGWFTDLFAAITGMLGLVWSATTAFRPDLQPASIRRLRIPLGLLALSVAWCFVQAWFPAPLSLAHSAWREASVIFALPVGSTLSLNPEASVAGALRLAGYGVVFLLCYQYATDERRAVRLLSLITLAGAVYALYGIILHTTGSDHVLWYERNFEDGNLSSTFPNRNAFASYATLCLICCFTLLYRRQLRLEDLSAGWRIATVAIFRYYVGRNWWLVYAAVALFAAIVLTHSRAGLATAIVAFLVFALCATRRARYRRIVLAGSIISAVCAGALLYVAGTAAVGRFGKLQSAATERMEIYRLTVDAIADRPVLGTGLGTFADVFPAYRSALLKPTIDFAHNSYLENALEMGVPAATVFYAALIILFLMFVKELKFDRTTQP